MNLAPMLRPISESFHEATEEHIREIEAQVAAELPEDYVSFLQHFGGAMFSGEALIRNSTTQTFGVFTLYAASGDTNSVLSDLKAHPHYLEAGLVPIADDLFNNRYVLQISSGEIFFIEYRRGTSQSFRVASSFGAFMEAIETSADETL